MEKENIIIIGGGPAGLAAAVYNARAALSPLVIAGSPPGGQLTLTSDVENYPGFESVLGPDLITKMRTHAQKFGTRFVDDNVSAVDFSQKPFSVTVSGGETYRADAVIVATGASALWLGLENETRLRGRGVSACATCDGFFFKGKAVAVVGGGDTAMEEALTLAKFASKVYVIHRRGEFRASKIMQQRVLEHANIEVKWNTTIEDVLGENKVEGLRLKDVSTNAVTDNFPVEGLFLAIGHKPATDFLKNSGVALDEKGYIKTAGWAAWESQNEKAKMPALSEAEGKNEEFNFEYQYATSILGVFAAGDCVDYVYRQAGVAAGMGIAAALDAERYLAEE